MDADLIQLAGMESVEAAGGPRIPFTPGEPDPLQLLLVRTQ